LFNGLLTVKTYSSYEQLHFRKTGCRQKIQKPKWSDGCAGKEENLGKKKKKEPIILHRWLGGGGRRRKRSLQPRSTAKHKSSLTKKTRRRGGKKKKSETWARRGNGGGGPGTPNPSLSRNGPFVQKKREPGKKKNDKRMRKKAKDWAFREERRGITKTYSEQQRVTSRCTNDK